jgi:hypothetical protein
MLHICVIQLDSFATVCIPSYDSLKTLLFFFKMECFIDLCVILALVVHSCKPSYPGGRDQEDHCLKLALG